MSWDVDGTLYSLGAMRWHLALAVARALVRGRGRDAALELAALQRRRRLVERNRFPVGVLPPSLRALCLDDRLLASERRWLAPAIARAGLRPGVRELLDALSARQIPLGAISDYTADYKLEALGLRDRFASVQEGVRLGCVKPSRKLFERAAAELGVAPENLLHIGDRADTDGAGARAAGCQVAILGRDIRHVRELAAIVQ